MKKSKILSNSLSNDCNSYENDDSAINIPISTINLAKEFSTYQSLISFDFAGWFKLLDHKFETTPISSSLPNITSAILTMWNNHIKSHEQILIQI